MTRMRLSVSIMMPIPIRASAGFTTYYTHSHQKALAASINDGLASSVNLRNRGSQPGDFLVLRENRQNAILIELGFLSNAAEERISDNRHVP